MKLIENLKDDIIKWCWEWSEAGAGGGGTWKFRAKWWRCSPQDTWKLSCGMLSTFAPTNGQFLPLLKWQCERPRNFLTAGVSPSIDILLYLSCCPDSCRQLGAVATSWESLCHINIVTFPGSRRQSVTVTLRFELRSVSRSHILPGTQHLKIGPDAIKCQNSKWKYVVLFSPK